MAGGITSGGVRLESIAERKEVAPGVMMPRLGLGTSRAYGVELERTIVAALGMGYRLIDTSANYDNEEAIGRAVASSGITRAEVFITTKLEGSEQGRYSPLPALRGSLRRLRLDYVDLYLIHWPIPELTTATWQAMEEILHSGLARSIGVSNFEVSDLEQLFSAATTPPAVNQIRLNPLEKRRDLHAFCVEQGIAVEAWAPVLRGHADRVETLEQVGEAHGKSAAQVSLRWLLQRDVIAIPKTVHESRLRENAEIFDFDLTDAEMVAIDAA